MLGALLAVTLFQTPASDTLTPILARGPVVLIEQGSDGKFGQATSIVHIDGTPDAVWNAVLDMEHYKDFMPKVASSDVVRSDGKGMDVRFVIEVPGPDTDYTVRYTRDDANKTLTGTWLKGDLKGSKWVWRVEAAPNGGSLLHHQTATRNFSGLAQSFDDEQQTITVGVNVSSAVAVAKAIKRRVEQPPPDAGVK